MKVLHVINNLGSGGAENMLINFFKELKGSKDYFEILLLVDDTIAYKNIDPHIKITILSDSKKRYSFKKLLSLYRYIKDNSFTIVHSHLFPSQYYVFLAKVLLKGKIKIITTEHNTTNTRRKYWLFRQIDKLVYLFYNRIILISKGVQEQFITDFPSLSHRGIVINNGIPLDHFKPVTNLEGTDAFKIIMVASFSKQKDHITLLKAMLLLDENISLTLVGVGEKQEEIQQFVESNALENRVHFLGFRSDIVTLYQQHKLFVLSSHWEGFGLVAAEAMASGLPVIASDVIGLKEVVKGAGFLFKPKNYKELAAHINEVVSNTNLRKQMIQQGLAKAKQYDISILVTKTLKLYKEIS